MTPIFLNQSSPFPLLEDHLNQTRLHLFTQASDISFPCPIFHPPQDQGAYDREQHHQHQQQQQEPNEHSSIGGSSLHLLPFPTKDGNSNLVVQQSACDQYAREDDSNGSVKWMSSKMRLMRKMMNSDRIVASKPRKNNQALQDQQQPNQDSSSNKNNSSISNGFIRVCSDCNTTKTPLWRSGPRGPKSLCNACGIRQRKARRAMAAAAVCGGLIPTEMPSKVQKQKRSGEDRTVPYKKRFKIAAAAGTTQKKLHFDDFTISLSKNSAFHRVFPQDEKDAAILLMALSCGLIHS